MRTLRQDFLEALAHEGVTRFKVVDETSVNPTHTRRYGRAAGGQRLDQAVPVHHGPNGTVAAALTPRGVEAVMALDGAVSTASFAACLEQVLGPALGPVPGPALVAGDAVVLGNLRVHKAAALAGLVEARGARLLFLPPYSPDFTPIEPAFSKRKAHLRTAAARTREALTAALQAALTWISAGNAQNWFDHCGYHVH